MSPAGKPRPLRGASATRPRPVFPNVVGPGAGAVSKMKLGRRFRWHPRLRGRHPSLGAGKLRGRRLESLLASFQRRASFSAEATQASLSYSLGLFRQHTKLFGRHHRPRKCLPFLGRESK